MLWGVETKELPSLHEAGTGGILELHVKDRSRINPYNYLCQWYMSRSVYCISRLFHSATSVMGGVGQIHLQIVHGHTHVAQGEIATSGYLP